MQRGGGLSGAAARRGRQRYTARCHVFDICQTLEASMRHPRPGAAYNIADDDPAPRGTVMAFAAELLARQAAGLSLAVGPDGGPGGEWGVHMSGMETASASSSSGSYDSAEDDHLAVAAAGRRRASMRRGEAREAAGLAVKQRVEEKRVRGRQAGWVGP